MNPFVNHGPPGMTTRTLYASGRSNPSRLTSGRGWQVAADELHSRTVRASYDSLATCLLRLHKPWRTGETWPTCQGCDRDDMMAGDAVWPCRTYSQIARTLLRVRDVEQLLEDIRRELNEAARTAGELQLLASEAPEDDAGSHGRHP